jgi:beta-glucanase (GH16 family)
VQFKGRSLTIQVLVTIAAVALFQVAPQKAMADVTTYGVSATATGQTFSTTFLDSDGFDGTVLLDTELWDANRNRVFQYFETRTLPAGTTTTTLTQPLTAGLPNGTYTVKAGMFTANWSKSLLWSDNVTTITINDGATAAFDASSTLNDRSFDTTFVAAQPMNGQYLFDVELWDSNNKRVFQYFDNFFVSNTSTMTVSRQLPATVAPGKYTARVGVFLPGWTTKLLWKDNAGSINLAATASSPVTYTSTATAANGNFETTFTSSRTITGSYLFDVELWDSNNKRVYQSFNTYGLNNGTTMTVTRAIPTNLAPGTYTIKSGWFTPNWSASLLWNENSGKVVIPESGSKPVVTLSPVTTTTTEAPTTTTTAAPATTTTTAPTTTTSPVVITKPEPVDQSRPTAPLSFTAWATPTGRNFETVFTATRSLTGKYLYDVELYDSKNKKVFQAFEVQEHNGENQAKLTQLIPTNIPAGKYTVKTGVFSPDWSVKYLWSEYSGTVNVVTQTVVDNNGTAPTGITGGNWKLAFGDEFNGSGLDRTKWTTCSRQLIWWKNTCMGHGKEQQAYTDDNVNIVDFGNGDRGLRLTARKAGTWAFTHDDVPAGSTRYDSGMISTSPNTMNFNQPGYQPFDFKYGFYEVRMKAPRGQGLWPAAWAFPTDNVGPQELDLVEILGHDTKTAYQTVHFPGGSSSIGHTGTDTADGFHTYGMDWQPDHIDWYIDGKLARTTFTKVGSIPDKNMYLMLNFAVGGQWPGAPDSTTPNSSAMDVDWVRVWKNN